MNGMRQLWRTQGGQPQSRLITAQMKMTTKNMILSVAAAIFVVIGASVSQAQVVIDDLTTAEKSAILADPNNEVVATAILQIERAQFGDYDLGAGLGATFDTDTDKVDWGTGGEDFGFNLVYNSAGNYELTITPPSASPITVSVAPTDWYNQLLFTIRANGPGVTLDLSGNIDGTDFRDLQATPGTTDGLRFDFPDSTASNVAEFAISGVFTPDTLAPGFHDGAFSGEFTLVKNATVPEPGSALLVALFALPLFARRRRGAPGGE